MRIFARNRWYCSGYPVKFEMSVVVGTASLRALAHSPRGSDGSSVSTRKRLLTVKRICRTAEINSILVYQEVWEREIEGGGGFS
jgi:hypothetical protein